MTRNFGIKNSSDRTDICKISYNFLTVATIWAVMLTKRIWAPKILRISKWAKLLEIMADEMYAVFHRFEAFHRWPVYCWMSIQRPSCFFNLCSSCSSRSNKDRRDCLLPPPSAGYAAAQASPPHRIPIAGQAIPLLTHTPCYSVATVASHRS